MCESGLAMMKHINYLPKEGVAVVAAMTDVVLLGA